MSDLKRAFAEGAQQAKNVAQTVETAGARIEAMQQRILGFADTLSSAFGVLGVTTSLKSAFDAFDQMEKGQLRLRAAIAMNGGEVESMERRYTDFAKSIEQVTLASKGEILSMVQRAESLGVSGAAAERAARNAIALAAAQGGDAESNIRLMAMLEQGNVHMLTRRLGLQNIKDETERVTVAQQKLTAMWAVAEAESNTVGGQIQRLFKLTNSLKKEVGELVSKAIAPFVDWLVKAGKWFKSLDTDTRKTVITVIALTGAMLMWGPAVAAVSKLWAPMSTVFGMMGRGPMLILALLNPMNLLRGGIAGLNLLLAVTQAILTPMGLLVTALVVAAGVGLAMWVDSLGGVENAWEAVKDGAMVAWRAAQFGFHNIGALAEVAWAGIQLGWAFLTEELTHFFANSFPDLLAWFADTVVSLYITDPINLALVSFTNLANNLVGVFTNLPGLLSGAVSWEDVWRPLTEGFETSLRELPEIAGRELSALELQLTADLEAQTSAIEGMWEQFNRDQDAQQSRRESDAYRDGDRIAEELNRGSKHGLEKFEAALAGSAEAMHRIAAFQDAISGRAPASRPTGSAAGLERPGGGGFDLSNMWNRVLDLARPAWDWIQARGGDMWQWIQDRAGDVWPWIQDRAGDMWQWAKDQAVAAWDSVKDTAVAFWDSLPALAEQFGTDLVNTAFAAWDAITGFGFDAWDAVEAWAFGLLDNMMDPDWWAGIADAASTFFTETVPAWAGTFFLTTLPGAAGAFFTQTLPGFFQGALTALQEGFMVRVEAFFTALKDRFDRLITGIADRLNPGRAVEQARSAIQSIGGATREERSNNLLGQINNNLQDLATNGAILFRNVGLAE